VIIKKALIATAGFGTRFLPISKTIQKEMLPILNRPTIDYVVEDCVKAGVEEIVFVINEHNIQIEHFYEENSRLRNYLARMGKDSWYDKISHLHSQAKYTFIKQPDDGDYGTGVPVKLAEDYLKGEEAFLVLMGDVFFYSADGSSEVQRMIQTFNDSGANGLATCVERPEETLSSYGVAQVRQENGYDYLETFVEKPAPGTAPSNLANASKYIFTPEVFDELRDQTINPRIGEVLITDPLLLSLAQKSKVVVHTPQAEFLDSGTVDTWLHANLVVAANDPKMRAIIKRLRRN
jgi:UTP--glucose-1-phosphate uridylyltransferase